MQALRGQMVTSPLVRMALVAQFAAMAVACGSDATDDPTDAGGGTDTTPDTGGGDGGSGDTGSDTSEPPVRENLVMFYQREAVVSDPALPDYTQLFVADGTCRAQAADLCDPGTCTATEVMPRNASEPLCNNGCFVTPDMGWLLFFDPSEGRTLRKAPLGADHQLTADSSIVATDVADFSYGDGIVALRSGNALAIHRLDDGTTVELAEATTPTGFYVAPDGSQIFLKRVTSLMSMSIASVDPATGTETVLYEFQDGGPRDSAGSLLRGSEPVALSPDGTRLAVLTTFRNQSNSCTSNADCTEDGFQCPAGASGGRCFMHQQSLHIVNLGSASLLGTECSSDSACGPDHFCDVSAPDDAGMGECMPGRILIGPTGQNVCARISAGEYDLSLPTMSWRDNNTVLALLKNSCLGEGTGIDVTDVAAIDTVTGQVDAIVENPGVAHGGCYDDVEVCYDAGLCNIQIERIASSPQGSMVGIVGDSYSSSTITGLWIADTAADDPKEVVFRSIEFNVRGVSLHTAP